VTRCVRAPDVPEVPADALSDALAGELPRLSARLAWIDPGIVAVWSRSGPSVVIARVLGPWAAT